MMREAVVAMTGVAGYLGRNLLRRLQEDDRVQAVVGVDVNEPRERPPKLDFHRRDITDTSLADLFIERKVTHVAHLAFRLDEIRDRAQAARIHVGGTRNVLEASLAAAVKRVVVASSSVVYGARPDNAPMLPESSPLRPDKGLGYGADKVALEGLCESFQQTHGEMCISTLRTVTIVGPHMSNFISRALEKPVQLLPRGFDPPWQFIHEDDCALAFQEMLWLPVSGPLNLAGDGTVPLSEVIRRLGKSVVRLPPAVIRGIVQTGWNLHLKSVAEGPGVLVNYFCHPPILDTARLKGLLKVPFRYTSEQAIHDFIDHKNASCRH